MKSVNKQTLGSPEQEQPCESGLTYRVSPEVLDTEITGGANINSSGFRDKNTMKAKRGKVMNQPFTHSADKITCSPNTQTYLLNSLHSADIS